MLGKIDESLAKQATKHCPRGDDSKKRKSNSHDDANRRPSKKLDTRNGEDMTIVEREAKAMKDLANYIEEVGGKRFTELGCCVEKIDVSKFLFREGRRSQLATFTSRVTKKSDGRYDVNFFCDNRRFRSMADVARFLSLATQKDQSVKKLVTNKKRPSSSRDAEAEKRKLRKELEKFMKLHEKATKALDDFRNEQLEKQYPVDDDVLNEELAEKNSEGVTVTRTTCPAARIPDLEGFPGIPDHCIADLLMVWDFLCTFSRALSLHPIQLDDFVAALTFRPPELDATQQPPVYLAEAHLALLKLLLADVSSDDWWWSILDADEPNEREEGDVATATIDPLMPVIKVDFGALLSVDEDPLLTSSWLQALEEVRSIHVSHGRQIKQAIKTASSIAANRWVKGYLKKALTDWKPDFAMFAKRAAIWLMDRVKEARPELYGRKVNTKSAVQQRTTTIDRIAILMAKMDDSGDVVAVSDLDSDDEDESDDESDDEDGDTDESMNDLGKEVVDENEEPVKTAIPEKPFPTLVDLLLPPSKPLPASDLVNPFAWPQLAGASLCRILHSYKHRRNMVDDKLRDSKGLPPMSRGERRQREVEASCRVSTESTAIVDLTFPAESAFDRLTKGGSYLELSTVERLCVLKILVDAAYDTVRIHEVVDSNYKQRHSAEKALDAEERRAKREAREEAAAADQAARESLAAGAREQFLNEKRNELRKLNLRTNEYSYAVIDELTDEDIIEFDEDSKAEYAALPTPQSYNKTEVNVMVKKMQEQAAFDTHSVAVVTMDEIGKKDDEELRAKEEELKAFDDTDVYELGREASRRLDRLRREIEQIRESDDTIGEVRESALEQLREAIEDGTVKSLKTAIRVAKQAKLCGPDESTGGVWTIDLLRDAALELKAAERRKRVIEARKDLVAKMNRCFIRTEPLGQDRFRNCVWHFENEGSARVWVEAQYILENGSGEPKHNEGYVDLVKPLEDIVLGTKEKEVDLLELVTDNETKHSFLSFSRKEFHRSGLSTCLVKRYWGGHASEKALKRLAKNLDDRGIRERCLKTSLKEALENSGLARSAPQEEGGADGNTAELPNSPEHLPEAGKSLEQPSELDEADNDDGPSEEKLFTTGDQEILATAIKSFDSDLSSVVSLSLVEGMPTAVGSRVRVRMVVDPNKQPTVAHYHIGVVVGWKQYDAKHSQESFSTNGAAIFPLWKAILDRGGGEVFLNSTDLIESICRFKKWTSNDKGYFEHDAAFLSYRNSLGRHCGKAADAGISATPMSLALLMVRREQELYNPLKVLSYDNNWGGKSGARNVWITFMRDDCYDFQGAVRGLLTLESALLELTGGFPDSMALSNRDAKSILSDHKARFDVELESIDKDVKTLWNSRQSRDIFLDIVNTCTSTGVLALALDLMCRNCWAFIDASTSRQKGRGDRPSGYDAGSGMRTTRRMNAWQQANQHDWF